MFPGRLLKGHLGDAAHDAGGIHSRSRCSLSCGREALVRSLRCLRGFPLAASREQQVTPTDGSEGGVTANAASSSFVFVFFFFLHARCGAAAMEYFSH